jgi:hypothetical protein
MGYGFHYDPTETREAYRHLLARRQMIVPRYQGFLRRLKRRLGPKVQIRAA